MPPRTFCTGSSAMRAPQRAAVPGISCISFCLAAAAKRGGALVSLRSMLGEFVIIQAQAVLRLGIALPGGAPSGPSLPALYARRRIGGGTAPP